MSHAPEDGSSPIRSTQVIAVADVVESVRLMEQDEREFIRRWQRFVGFVQERLPQESGRLHKSLGDGLMLAFSDPHGCVRAAVAMRDWFAQANRGLAPEDHVQLRIGAHVAEFVADQYDIYGTDVNLAARIASLAGPGEIVISAALRRRLAPHWQRQMEDLGTCHLKHVKEPVHAYRIGEAGPAPVMPMRRPAGHSLRPTLGVLPFGMHGHAAGGLTGEALADDVVAALARSDLLQVVSRVSTAPFGGAAARLDEIRRAVGAHYVLTGRARRHDSDLSLFVELADTGSGHVSWAQSFRGPLTDVALGHGHLMREVVTAVHSAVIARETERSRGLALPAVEGHGLLLSAVGLMHRLTAGDTELARHMLEHLAERSRGQAAPHAWLSHLCALQLRQHGAQARPDAAAAARQHAATALRCDSASAFALAADGQSFLYASHDRDTAQERYAQALRSRPDDSLVLLLQAELLALLGRGKAAREAATHACAGFALEPLAYLYDGVRALAALVCGDAAGAARLAQAAVERNPNYLPALRMLAVAQVQCGEVPEAARTLQRLTARRPDCTVRSMLTTLPACDAVLGLFADSLQRAGLPAA